MKIPIDTHMNFAQEAIDILLHRVARAGGDGIASVFVLETVIVGVLATLRATGTPIDQKVLFTRVEAQLGAANRLIRQAGSQPYGNA